MCGDRYDDDDSNIQEFWVGCDRCPRWFHYWCVNLSHMPESEEPFICPACSFQLTSHLAFHTPHYGIYSSRNNSQHFHGVVVICTFDINTNHELVSI